MKDLRTWRFRFVVIALVVGGFLGWMALQQSVISTADAAQKVQTINPGLQMLPASAKGPPEMDKLKEDKTAPTKERTRPTREALLQKVTKQQGGQEKVQQAKAKQQGKTVLRASSTEPPETAKMKDTKAAPTQERTRPTRDTLLQQVLKQPGGKDKIQKAKPEGFKLGAGPETTGWFFSSLSHLNPFQAGVAHASGTPLILTPYAPTKSSPFYGKIYINGEISGAWNSGSTYARLYNRYWGSSIGTRIDKPSVYLNISVPTSGWYLINFETFNGAKATLKHWTGSGYATVQTWDERSHYYHTDHPVLLNLSVGSHYFYWIVEPGTTQNMYLYRVSVEKM
ncbi:MAG: hypothetical protein JXC33_02415 [Deltaproteobacteria bacterium]|nr:hypothetical protein [Deltaproteobacteria bacterium]